METKQDIRKQLQLKRDSMPQETRTILSRTIQDRLLARKEYEEAELVFIYCAFKSETDTGRIALHTLEQGKILCCPKIETGRDGRTYMEFYRVSSLMELTEGYFGVPEPATDSVNKISAQETENKKCFMVVPGCGFDREGYRMGYGKGFYDRYLTRYPGILKAGICFDEQLLDSLPHEAHDVKMDFIITQTEILSF